MVEDNLTKKEVKIVEKEVKKRLHQRVVGRAKNSAGRFKSEFKKQAVTAITAAFAFLIALSWRTPIQNSVNKVIENLGLIGKEIYIEYLSAIIITIVAVIALILLSKWASEKDKKV